MLIDCVVMCGGFGSRLKPFTYLIPKPFLTSNDISPFDYTIKNLSTNNWINKIFITIHYKKNYIKKIIKNKKIPNLIKVEEKKPLGTAASLNLIKTNKSKNLLVINCDTILNINFDKLLDYHVKQENDFTLVAAFKKIIVPYGICEINKKQNLKNIIEKPTSNNLVVVGAYCFKKNLIKYIPKKKFFDMNDFVKKLILKKYKVGIYPISDLDWQDIGEWPEYYKTISNFQKK